ncbi:MAG: polysaccharide deacetylase family protein [Acidobacteriota bacterium]|nr:polysaccharide deacetylase family protein [Acidobacteriota bacterium]
MNFEFLTTAPLVENLGWTLAHSLWQISAIAALCFLGLKVARNSTANLRYLLACTALFLTLALPAATFVWFTNAPEETRSFAFVEKTNGKKTAIKKPVHDERSAAIGKSESGTIANPTPIYSLESLQTHFENYFVPNLPILVWFWLAGVLFFALRTGGGLLHLHNLKTKKNVEPSAEWQRRFAYLCREIGVSTKAKLRESGQTLAPVVVGWLKPVILIPSGAFLGVAPAQLEAIIVHELMHVRRADFLVNFLQTLVEILLFYHPGVWWISKQIRREREFVCDDLVVRFYGEPLAYARALANLEQFRQQTKTNTPQLSLAADGGNLMKRIQRILQKETETSAQANSLWSAGLAFVLISAFLLTAFWSKNELAVNAAAKKGEKKIAVGFVSIPPADRSDNPPHDSQATTQILIEKLNKHRVPAIGFLVGASVSDGEKLYPVRAEIVRQWRDAGLEVGIGGYKHIWFYNTSYDDYVANVEKNERIAKQILGKKSELRYFSYPFLNTGKTTEDKLRFENWLASRGLQSVKYTFDNQEWMYSYAYDMARKDNDLNTMKEIRAEFLDYMTKMLLHFEAYSQELFNRQIPQTIVLTPSRLVADTADDLFGMLEKRDYSFISIDQAQADEAYKTEENFVGESGISWFERWQMKRGARLLDEPRVSRTVWQIWETQKNKK